MGVGFMCHGNHYDPSPEIRAKNYHKANASGVGYDRSSSTGSNYVGQYFSPNREAYNSPELCPEELLLFMHHLPYTHKLKNGTTLIQHIYNSRYNGLSRLESAVSDWRDLVGKIDHERHQHVLDKLNKQFEHAIVWRDSIYNYFLKLSGIPDKIDRA
jgi:alpha-glucuronidase